MKVESKKKEKDEAQMAPRRTRRQGSVPDWDAAVLRPYKEKNRAN